ncbi:hypothetical protein JL49_01250 [Pseudoalteromonas luteoviolacea]|nr:hypothetical protein JL49_01250 [Pseudoalteromonas luteoviolacea]
MNEALCLSKHIVNALSIVHNKKTTHLSKKGHQIYYFEDERNTKLSLGIYLSCPIKRNNT